jgi:hypothetical protein
VALRLLATHLVDCDADGVHVFASLCGAVAPDADAGRSCCARSLPFSLQLLNNHAPAGRARACALVMGMHWV